MTPSIGADGECSPFINLFRHDDFLSRFTILPITLVTPIVAINVLLCGYKLLRFFGIMTRLSLFWTVRFGKRFRRYY